MFSVLSRAWGFVLGGGLVLVAFLFLVWTRGALKEDVARLQGEMALCRAANEAWAEKVRERDAAWVSVIAERKRVEEARAAFLKNQQGIGERQDQMGRDFLAAQARGEACGAARNLVLLFLRKAVGG